MFVCWCSHLCRLCLSSSGDGVDWLLISAFIGAFQFSMFVVSCFFGGSLLYGHSCYQTFDSNVKTSTLYSSTTKSCRWKFYSVFSDHTYLKTVQIWASWLIRGHVTIQPHHLMKTRSDLPKCCRLVISKYIVREKSCFILPCDVDVFLCK